MAWNWFKKTFYGILFDRFKICKISEPIQNRVKFHDFLIFQDFWNQKSIFFSKNTTLPDSPFKDVRFLGIGLEYDLYRILNLSSEKK